MHGRRGQPIGRSVQKRVENDVVRSLSRVEGGGSHRQRETRRQDEERLKER